MLLLAQAAPVNPADVVIGPYGALLGAVIVIGWLVKRLNASEKANTELVERLIAQSEKSIPLLERVARSLEARDTDR